jgi:nitrite reductase (NO-forming)
MSHHRNSRSSTVRAAVLAAALILTAALASACQGGVASSASAAGGGAASQQWTIKAHDSMKFEQPTLTVPVGQPVQVTLVNDGTLIHDFVLTSGVEQPVKIEANGKSTASGTFTIARAGTYTYICAQPGHEAAGMKGTIVAK